MGRLLLFDIDGTLLDCGRQTRGIIGKALSDTFSTVPQMSGYSFAGRTDLGILFDLMEAQGKSEEDILSLLPEMKRRYLDALEAGLKAEHMRLLGGARELLDRLRAEAVHTLGLLTGNWEEGAKIKLSRFDLNQFFAFGGFGDVSRHRVDLVPAALEAARRAGATRHEKKDIVLIGDSVRDVECARHHGVGLIAVSTGGTPAEELLLAGADRVAADLHEAGDWIDQGLV